MIGLVQLVVFGFIALSVVYLLVAAYSQSTYRERLEKRWDRDAMEGDREAFLASGMAAYRKSLRRKLIVLVYIIPVVVVGITVYAVNHQ